MQQREATPKAPALDTKISPTGPSDALRDAAARAEAASADAEKAAAEAADKAHWEEVRQQALRKTQAKPPARASFCGC